MNATQIEAYKCPRCEELFDNEMDATGCCGHNSTTAYQCGNCESLYEDEDAAEQCCKE